MLLGLVRPDAGEVMLLGRPVADPRPAARVGYLPELFRYQPWLTAAEVLALHVRLARRRGARAGAARLPGPRRASPTGPATASAASPRACSSASGWPSRWWPGPELVVLDEPTSALDPLGRADVRDIVLDAQGAAGSPSCSTRT